MWKAVEIFYKKDSSAQLTEARMGGEGHELPHQGLWTDVGGKNFVLSGSISAPAQSPRISCVKTTDLRLEKPNGLCTWELRKREKHGSQNRSRAPECARW